MIVWYVIVWFCTAGACPERGDLHVFDSAEACQSWRARYIDTHPSDPERWVISRCKAKEVEH